MEYQVKTNLDNTTDTWFRVGFHSGQNSGSKRERVTECNSTEGSVERLRKKIKSLEQRLVEDDATRGEESEEELVKRLEAKIEKLEEMINKKQPAPLPQTQKQHEIQNKPVQGDGNQDNGHKMRKAFDDTLRQLYVDQYSTIMKSVGCLISQNGKGTLFRVGTKYGMTAAHVVNAITNPHRQPVGDATRLCRDQVYVSFSESGVDQSNKFKLAGRVEFCDNTLDVAIVEFSEEDIETLPPPLPLLRHDAFSSPDNNDVAVVGYGHKQEFKCVEPSVKVVDPESVPVSDIKNYLEQKHPVLRSVLKCTGKDYMSVDLGYTGYKDKHHILLNAFVGSGASGSPILTKGDPAELQVVGIYTCGYPKFSYELPNTIQYPIEWTFEAGTKMNCIYDALSSQHQKLAEDIFSG